MIIVNCEQGTEEWFAARCGVVTASEFSSVMAKGRGNNPSKTRLTYMMKKVGEQLTDKPADSWGGNAHTERGHDDEPMARILYEGERDVEVDQVGIILFDDRAVGYSPDGLVAADGLVEIKSKTPHRHIECLLEDQVPAEHIDQLQGGLWVAEREWIDFISYCSDLPLFVKRVYRDEKRIAEIKAGVEAFLADMAEMKERVLNYRSE